MTENETTACAICAVDDNKDLVEVIKEVPGIRTEAREMLKVAAGLFGLPYEELRKAGVPNSIWVLVRDTRATDDTYLTYFLLSRTHPLAKMLWLCSVVVRVRQGEPLDNEVPYALSLAADTYPAFVEWFAEETAKVLED